MLQLSISYRSWIRSDRRCSWICAPSLAFHRECFSFHWSLVRCSVASMCMCVRARMCVRAEPRFCVFHMLRTTHTHTARLCFVFFSSVFSVFPELPTIVARAARCLRQLERRRRRRLLLNEENQKKKRRPKQKRKKNRSLKHTLVGDGM